MLSVVSHQDERVIGIQCSFMIYDLETLFSPMEIVFGKRTSILMEG